MPDSSVNTVIQWQESVGISRSRLAFFLGYSRSFVSRVFNGDKNMPIEFIRRFSELKDDYDTYNESTGITRTCNMIYLEQKYGEGSQKCLEDYGEK